MKSSVKTFLFWLTILVALVLLWNFVSPIASRKLSEISFSQFMSDVNQGKVAEVTIASNEVNGRRKDNSKFRSNLPPDYTDVVKTLNDKGVIISFRQNSNTNWIALLSSSSPALLLFVIWFFMMRQMQSGSSKTALSFGKSHARLLSMQQKKVVFKDVAGVDEAKEQLQEIVEYLREPQKFQKLGGRIPKGVLLAGPPGTGKTLLARAVAGEANVPFFSISGSDFVEMFVGVGASRVRDLFDQGKKNAPCIIFIDEIDAVGRHRGAGLGGGHDEREQTLNQLLVEMDGFESNEGVILMAATNRPDVLDTALLRPGRFDRRVLLSYPNLEGREQILRIHTRLVPLDDKVSIRHIAELTPGFSGADLGNLVNEAALSAARNNLKMVAPGDFEESVERIRSGLKEKLPLESPEDKWRVAIHEVGHLMASFLSPSLARIESLSIYIPYRPEWFSSKEMIFPNVVRKETAKGTLVVLLAGRAAEEIFLQDVSSLSSNDTAIATALAQEMVTRWGLGEKAGLVNDSLARELLSERAAEKGMAHVLLDTETSSTLHSEEIKRLLDEAYQTALQQVQLQSTKISEWATKLFESEKLGPAWIDRVRSTSAFSSRVVVSKTSVPNNNGQEIPHVINHFDRSIFSNAVIGPGGSFVTSSEVSGNPQSQDSTDSRKGGEMSNFAFNNNQMTNNVVGDYGTFNQNVQKMDIAQLASDLNSAQTRANQKASTEEEKADAKNISDAAVEAAKGNKVKVAEYLHKVGKWGWEILKEVGCSLAVESMKQMIGL